MTDTHFDSKLTVLEGSREKAGCVKMDVGQYDRNKPILTYIMGHMKLLNMRSSSIFVRIKCRQSLTYFDIIKSTAKNKFILLTSILNTLLFQVEIRNKPRTNIGT